MDTALVWFRNNLRVQDNTALTKAVASGNRVMAVYFFDPRHFEKGEFGFKKTEKFRAQFLIETVRDLQKNLRALNISLLVLHDKPEHNFETLCENYGVTEIHSQKEWTSEENDVTNAVDSSLKNIKHSTYYDQFLYHPEDIPYADFNDIPKVFTVFRKKCEKQSSVRKIQEELTPLSRENMVSITTRIPSLSDLGFEEFQKDNRSAFPWEGGEQAAWSRVEEYFWQSKNLKTYKKTRNGLVGQDYSSKLSAWLANGAISARQLFWEVQRFEEEVEKNESTYWLIFELIWRDFFKYVSLKHGNAIFKRNGILDKDYHWKSEGNTINSWINGATEYDFVNANMIELRESGWMSNRGRQNVASYFAKEKEQDWRIGAAYFESVLIDYDVHSNYCNWMYNAGVGNDPRDRKFNIKSQQDRYDENGKFVQRWLQNELF
ncbi:DASH family cryptochrome [Dokdonia sp. Hel_I_53]|uniref:DASH family cryptochrome n=1 Tax=Dokdonia sp. Hel_I_53 TaxID=1566287 RepID=UPI0011993ACE|nr:DASH family cryptochrome [Dokdonia sp. Hel_I_53]TVZ52837.1 deoxyribodipyrimidine photo-lyase (single-stranded DNA-specific) [Dokdonia sp. Hel_I_53]